MLRFVLNFILFGLLFYAIWYFFPDVFNKMVSGAKEVFDYIKNLFQNISEKTQQPAPATPPSASLMSWLRYFDIS